MKNKHTLIIALVLFATSLLQPSIAQDGLNVPFSQYGIGLTDMPYNMPRAFGMGGTIYSRSSRNTVNPFNPASYAAVESESFVFDIGINIQNSVLRGGNSRLPGAEGSLAYLAVAFPITHWWKTSIGMLPFSIVNYESVHTLYDPLTDSDVKTVYDGNGGVTQFYWGNAFNITPRLSFGFNVNYLYGGITRAITYQFQHNDSTYCMNSRSQKNTQTSNLLFDLGLQYSQPVGAKHTLRFGATCRLPRTSTIKDQTLAYTFLNYASTEYLFDTIFPASDQPNTYNSTLHQPLTFGLGLALERNNRWEIDLDAYYAPKGDLSYQEDPGHNIFGATALRTTPNFRVALGYEWKGNPDAATYWGRIGLSAGLYHNHGKLALQPIGHDLTVLNETGGGLAVHLPMRKGRSLLTLALGYSSFGDASLLRRDTFTFGIAVGSCERWFVKRKYN